MFIRQQASGCPKSVSGQRTGSLDAVAAYWNDVYFFRYDHYNAYNSLYYLNAAPNNSTPVVMSQSVNDVFAGMDQQMSVKDMTLVKGVNIVFFMPSLNVKNVKS
ncbi:hypothetical protein [Bacterioplanoides pacificum]|uniref:Uncharacterized protein n=1 Tax=Bacterioplanoides pacificum TaxID=1171596 RepID=A0ABV7VW32_9GAMM